MMVSMDKEMLEKLSAEKSVRGAVVRKALERHEQADEEQKVVVEKALELLLARFQNEQEGSS